MRNRLNEMKSCKEFLTERKLMLSVVAIMLGILLLAPLAAAAKNPNPGVLPVDSHAYGMTYGEWSAKWWQWALSIPADSNPLTDTTGEFCAEGQSGKVWFIGGVIGQPGDMKPSAERNCNIPAGKALFFPIMNCESSELEYGFTTEAAMRADATATINTITDLKVEVDGKELKDLWSYRVQSDLFTFFTPQNTVLTQLTRPIPEEGTTSDTVSDGYWIMLAPLSAGEHTIHIYGEAAGVFVTDVTYYLTVVPGGSTK